MPSAASLISLPPGDIHLWFCFHGDAGNPELTAASRALLSAEELSKQARFHFARDRHRHLLTRTLVRSVLSRYAPVAPQTWQFATNAFGRPRIGTCDAREAVGLNFNLSHTDGLIVLAVARHIELGVDVENVERKAALDVANHYFSPAEAQALDALPSTDQAERFFELWTLKESYIKARGLGLQIPLDSFGFALDDPGTIGFALADSRTGDDAVQRWHYWQLRPTPKHLVALCAATDPSTAATTRIVCREIAPLEWDRPLAAPTTRTSAGI
ncbi:4'-phosphopantetheinyl transferase superfamily protein [Variovorax paradoxus]|uniref:4'-phosphopantetheinyl transferase superfamily protein n=1 Tax=Variovorax paradoxus TaxID=34073 RepID=A0A5Q0M6M7_VARPD|nr:4'-phosphopantetheinyl transferase superfamily protein [Variovorax paradoxus]